MGLCKLRCKCLLVFPPLAGWTNPRVHVTFFFLNVYFDQYPTLMLYCLFFYCLNNWCHDVLRTSWSLDATLWSLDENWPENRSELDLLLVLTAWYIRSRGSCSSVMLMGRNWKCYYRLHSVNILRTTMKNASHFRTAYKETDKRKMWRDARGLSVGGCTIGPE